jgi:hypothetical protein
MFLASIRPAGPVDAACVTANTIPGFPPMSKMRVAAVVAFAVLSAPCARGGDQPHQFSADLVYDKAGVRTAAHSGKLNVADRKIRIELPDLAIGFFIVRSDAAAAYFVKPAQRVFMDAKQTSELTQLLVPVDPDDPCRQWQAMAQIAGVTDQGAAWRCERIGDESIAGRRTIKYQGISPREDRYLIWIDPRIDFVVKLEANDGSVEVANIQEGPQPAQLFEIPAGYAKFDPQKLIDRIKQSDVWVEPPQ